MRVIIPAPQLVNLGTGKLILGNAININATAETQNASAWLAHGLELFAGTTVSSDTNSTTITLRVDADLTSDLSTLGVRADGADANCEFHRITIAPDRIDVVGVSPEAVFRGVTTVIHLIAQASVNGLAELPTGTITDAPLFAWRGLSFDTVRCFHPVETVKKVLDLLAFYKMNVFHFHLTDTEGWRFHVDEWPLLTEVSGKTARDNRPGGFYTTEEFAEIVQYAADRYITVVPEFDSPGHTASVLAAYPELGSDEIRATAPAMHYLHPDREGVPALIADVYSSMAAQTNGSWLHIGGDEAIAMKHEVFQEYIQMALPLAHATGKGVVAWQEAARGGLTDSDLAQWWIPPFTINAIKKIRESGNFELFNTDLDPEVVKGFVELFSTADQDIPTALAAGANIIISPATWLYLDTKYVEESTDLDQLPMQERLGLPVYGNGTVADAYDWDPRTLDPDIPEDRIAGVEAAIWCETITNANDLFFQLLPRLAGVAEKSWSAPQQWNEYLVRLRDQPRFWDAMGLTWFKSSVVW